MLFLKIHPPQGGENFYLNQAKLSLIVGENVASVTSSWFPEAELQNEQSKGNTTWGHLGSKSTRFLWLWMKVCALGNKFWQHSSLWIFRIHFLNVHCKIDESAGIYTKIRVFVTLDTDLRTLTFGKLGNNYLALIVSDSSLYFYSNCLASTETLKFDKWDVLVSTAAVTNYHTNYYTHSGLRQNKIIILQFWILKAEVSWQAEFSGGLKEESSFLFLASIWRPSAALAYSPTPSTNAA